MNEDKYLEFLTDLLHDTGRPIIVIGNNASYHSGKFWIGFNSISQ